MTKVVVDKDLIGWATEHRAELLKDYDDVVEVGKHHDLPQRTSDGSIGLYCKKNNCEFLTADREAYTEYFGAGIKTIQIRRYGSDEKGDKEIFLLKIVD